VSSTNRVAFRLPATVAILTILAGIASAGPAFACGASAGGAAGISGCSLEEHEEGARLKWRLGAEYAFTSTGLHFSDGLRVEQIRNAALVTVDYRPLRRITLEAGAGPFLAGSITANSVRMMMAPGFVGIAGASWRVLDSDGAIPFVLLGAQLSYFSSATAGNVGYSAFDLRGSVAVGTTIWDVLTPYVVGRAFGGPVYWRYMGAAILGTDDHHWQAGVGVSLVLVRKVDVFVEGVPLGELGATAGAGIAF
jgi:hypothetical protein